MILASASPRRCELLRAIGLDAEDVRDQGLGGADDATLFKHAVASGRAIITLDVGLGDVTKYPLGTHHGIIVVRLQPNLPAPQLRAAIVAAVRLLPEQDLEGNVVVLSPRKLRIHRKP
jgi:predicted nuclease of predicted toxin-antitoxin system